LEKQLSYVGVARFDADAAQEKFSQQSGARVVNERDA
jgi:hypothetical protein